MSPLRRALEPFITPIFRTWWRINRGMTLGVRGVATDAEGRVLLIKHTYIDGWFLPGGGVDHGEHPDATVVREVREETGLDVRVTRVREVLTDVVDLPHRDVQVHTVRLVYDVEVVGGRLRAEPDGSSDALAVLAPNEAARLWLAPYVARALGLPEVPLGVANFPAEIILARRRWVEHGNNLVHWSEFDRGGHFAALEEPALLLGDIRTFFRALR